MSDMNEFLELAHRAGLGSLNGLETAEALEISTSYVAKLRSGTDPVSSNIRAKLDALIAAKGDGPVESTHVLEHGEIKERAELTERASTLGPAPRPPKQFGSIDKFVVIKVSDGYAVAQNFVAVFRGVSWAEEYADWLNDQIRRGKEGD